MDDEVVRVGKRDRCVCREWWWRGEEGAWAGCQMDVCARACGVGRWWAVGGWWWRRERGGGERRAATRPRTSRATCARTLAGKDNGIERRADVGKGRRKNRARKGGREVVEQEIEAKKASIGWSMEAESERQATTKEVSERKSAAARAAGRSYADQPSHPSGGSTTHPP
jgi:hypothetical protein